MLCLKKTKRKQKRKREPKQRLPLCCRRHWAAVAAGFVAALFILFLVLAVPLQSCFAIFVRSSGHGSQMTIQFDVLANTTIPLKTNFTVPYHYNYSTFPSSSSNFGDADGAETASRGPYHDWKLFAANFQQMMRSFKMFVYPDISADNDPFAPIFRPHPDPFNPRLRNYFSEHMFKVALLRSSLITPNPEEAHLFFLPFSINSLRNDRRVHSEILISEFVAQYTTRISRQFPFWNASAGADHFYVCCHSVGREAASRDRDLHGNSIQVTCSSSYFQRFYVTHKDVGLPQVWPRSHRDALTPPHARHKLVYFAGRIKNSHIRQQLITLWENDTHMDIFHASSSFPYEEGFRRSKYCPHVKGYEVNTARISDAIHYGCIPVILSNYYDLPFADVLDWNKFSVIMDHRQIAFLKQRLLSITKQNYLSMFHNLLQVRRHFTWHQTPRGYDSFYMTAYELWLRRNIHRVSSKVPF